MVKYLIFIVWFGLSGSVIGSIVLPHYLNTIGKTIIMKEEIWKDVPNYEGSYQVSNFGRVRSLTRKMRNRNGYSTTKGTILKPNTSSSYARVGLHKNSTKKMRSVHQLVAMAFLAHKPHKDGFVVNHINFNKVDNRLDNLELVTHRENSNMKHIPSKSEYVGVHYRKNRNHWVARINYGKTRRYISSHKNEYDAHLAYQDELKHQRLNPIYNG